MTAVAPDLRSTIDPPTSTLAADPLTPPAPAVPTQEPSTARAAPVVTDAPRRIVSFSRGDWIDLVVAMASAAALTGVIHTVMDWGGLLGPSLWWLASFLVLYRVLVGQSHGPIVATDRMMSVVIVLGGLVSIAALSWLVIFVFAKGFAKLRPSFFTEDMSSVGPLDDGGGAFHAIVGTGMQVGLATIVAVPASILTAVYLHEIKGRMAPFIRFFVDAMSGLPSIIAGLLVYTIWIRRFEQGYSGIAASMALTILMLPTITRTTEEILKTIPGTLREAALALGAPEWRVVTRIVLPTAQSGLITASLLGIARAIGETAPILLTAQFASAMNANPLEGKQASLPMFVYQLIKQPNDNQIARAWTGALLLLILVLVLFVIARIVGERGRKKRGG